MYRPNGLLGGLVLVMLAGAAQADDAVSPAAPGDTSTASVGNRTAGERVFVKCRACHQVGGNAHNAVGPELNGVIGRHSGSVKDYNYSDANKSSGLTWDPATFRRYIANPRAVVPGTKMTFAGLSREKDIDDVLAYLEQFNADGSTK